jgi:hypothetical protein
VTLDKRSLSAHHPEMSRKPTPKPDNPEQFKRFIDMAREIEVDESPDALDRALERVVGKPSKQVHKNKSGA